MSVLHVSTDSWTVGNILSCNTQVLKFLGYEKSELIGSNVHKIMPKVYHDIHNDFIKNYLETIG